MDGGLDPRSMMLTYVAAAFLGIVILLAMIGWGGILHRILRLSGLRDWAVLACMGFAFSTFAGGLLNLAGIISPRSVGAYLAIGFLASLLRWPDAGLPEGSLKGLGQAGLVIAVAVGLLLCMRLVGSLVVLSPTPTPVTFNVFDDFQGYFVYPEKMIQTGSMGFDPYSLRRTATHSLGGSAFLKSMVLTLGSEQNFYLLDAGLGSILTIGLLLAWAKRLGLTLAAALGTILIFLAIPPPIYNTNSQLLTTAFFLTLFYVFPQTAEEPNRVSRAALVGLLIAGICALRTNLIPAVFVFVAANGLLAALRSHRKAQALFAAALPFAFCVFFLLPWLLDAYRWTGQPLPFSLHSYNAAPDFIAGYQKSNGWHSLRATITGLPRVPYFVLAVLAVVVLPGLPRRSLEKQLFLSALTAAAIGSLAVLVGMGGFNALARYVFPFLTAAILLAIVLFRSVPRRTIAFAATAMALGIWVLSDVRVLASMYRTAALTPLHVFKGHRLIAENLANRYRRLQQAAAPGTSLQARLDYPFLLDFRRNHVLIVDSPGGAGADPGLPYFQGSERLATYLVSQNIRYIAYDYASACGAPKNARWLSLAANPAYPMAQSLVRHSFDLNDNYLELSRTHALIYDDGSAFLIDLMSPRQPGTSPLKTQVP